jgi:tetratricopeptide (TPR) repeat protein
MSLLLDARKKSQHASSAHTGDTGHPVLELSLEPHPDSASQPVIAPTTASSPDNNARTAGQNLFNAKSNASMLAPGINRNLLIGLGGTVLLLIAGAGYVWYTVSATQPYHPINSLAKPAPAITQPQNNLVSEIASTQIVSAKPASTARPAHAAHSAVKVRQQARNNSPMLVEQHQDDSIDPLLNNAYLAYRSGKLDEAQQLYSQALKLDTNNTDTLLGLAVIAQRRGKDNEAAHYYSQVMALDPRNAVANAGMSALTNDDNRESRLKTLLDEQPNSSSLHLALGNYYAGQARWGEAQRTYFEAYKFAPDQADLAFNLAVSLDRLGQKKSAAQYYQRALQLDPENHAGFDHAIISQRIKELAH